MTMQCFMVAHPAYIYIHETIIVDVYHRNTGRPGAVLRDFCFFRDIPEMKSPRIQIKPVRNLVRSKEYINFSVIIKISRADASSIIEIHILKYIEFLRRRQLIGEIKSGSPGI